MPSAARGPVPGWPGRRAPPPWSSGPLDLGHGGQGPRRPALPHRRPDGFDDDGVAHERCPCLVGWRIELTARTLALLGLMCKPWSRDTGVGAARTLLLDRCR